MRGALSLFRRVHVGLAVSEHRLVGIRNGSAVQRVERELPEGLVTPSPVSPNIRSVSELAQSVQSLLEELSVDAGPVALVLPDLAVTTVLFPSGNGAGRSARLWEELAASLPYPKVEARHDFWRGPGREMLGAAVRDTVVRQYEEVVEATGFRPGWVDGASLALIPRWSESSRGESLVAAQVQLYRSHYCLTVMRQGELIEFRTKLRAQRDLAAVSKELLRIPALHGVSRLGSLSLFGEDAALLASEMENLGEFERIRVEEESEDGQLAAAILALLDRPLP